jgi:hypothetical protein
MEICSLKQGINILKNHTIIFVTYKKLDCTIYNQICHKYNVNPFYEYFSYQYFTNTEGYNALLLSKKFYARFIKYNYFLIYQLDAYVFSDQLDYWCEQDYDYIGAPWLLLAQYPGEAPAFGNDYNLMVGNGGFSLRKTKTFINAITPKIQFFSCIHFINSFFDSFVKKSKTNYFFMILHICFCPLRKTIEKIICRGQKTNEDVIWSEIMLKYGKVPPPDIALKFAFDSLPAYLYELNNAGLPFGCHAWHLYYHFQFWKNYISLE